MNVLPSYRPKVSYPLGKNNSGKIQSASQTIRPIYLRGGITSQSPGSATCELGKTKVVCSIHGPRPRRQLGRAEFSGKGAIDVEATYAPFSHKDSQSREELEQSARQLAMFLENCLQSSVQLSKFPKSVLDVYVSVLEDDGSSFACAALAASYALAKTGVEMTDLVTCCTMYLTDSGEIGVDPDSSTERNAKALCTVGFLGQGEQVVAYELASTDACDVELLARFNSIGAQVCSEICQLMRTQLKQETAIDGV